MKETKTELWRCQKRNILSVILLHIFLHDGKQALRSQQRNRAALRLHRIGKWYMSVTGDISHPRSPMRREREKVNHTARR